jgi:hypothetical protein
MDPVLVAGMDLLRKIDERLQVFVGKDLADFDGHGVSSSLRMRLFILSLSYFPAKKATGNPALEKSVQKLRMACGNS